MALGLGLLTDSGLFSGDSVFDFADWAPSFASGAFVSPALPFFDFDRFDFASAFWDFASAFLAFVFDSPELCVFDSREVCVFESFSPTGLRSESRFSEKLLMSGVDLLTCSAHCWAVHSPVSISFWQTWMIRFFSSDS